MNFFKKNTTFLFLFLFLFLVGSLPAKNNQGKLSIKIVGANNEQGKLVVYVFREKDDIFGKTPYLRSQTKIYAGVGNVEFKKIPYESYSIMAFHDKNNNNIMDHNFMKLPTEAFGFSNNWNFSLFSGKPSFRKTKFNFSENNNQLTIKVQ